jgi:hypothetical protein
LASPGARYVDPLSMTNMPAPVELSFDLYSMAAIEVPGFLGSQDQSLRPTSSLDLLLTLNKRDHLDP